MLSLAGISKRYVRRRHLALDAVTISVAPGEVVALVGLNGAGKTTVMRIAAGVTLPTRGGVSVDGIRMDSEKSRASRKLGWVPEIPIHDALDRVESLLAYYSDVAGDVPTERTEALLQDWGLTHHRRSRFRELSMGMKRRFSLVVASLTDPRYFLLDEPFNGLDPSAVVQLRRWVARARNDHHGILLSSHNLHEIQNLADRISVLRAGRVVASLRKSEFTDGESSEIKVELERVDEEAVRLLSRYGSVAVEGPTVVIRNANAGAADVNEALVAAHYRVKELTVTSSRLEEAFVRLVGEER